MLAHSVALPFGLYLFYGASQTSAKKKKTCARNYTLSVSGRQQTFVFAPQRACHSNSKDGIPYPVDRPLYDQTIELLERAIRKAKLGQGEELQALRRMEKHFKDVDPSSRT